MYDILIKNGLITDGTGKDSYVSDIAIKNGVIVEITSNIKEDAIKVIDATEKTVTPGFIDMHSHGDLTAPFYPDMESPLGQGVTTIFSGHCGLGISPVDTYWLEMCPEEAAISKIYPKNLKGHGPGFERLVKTEDLVKPIKEIFGVDLNWRTYGEYLAHLKNNSTGINIIACVGHACIRIEVMGEDYRRKATKSEICKMKALLKRSFDEGAWGLSFGLDYNPGMYAGDDELLELAKVCAKYDRILTAHVRMNSNRDNPDAPHEVIDGIREFLSIGEKSGAKIHISHIVSGFTILPYDLELAVKAAQRTLDIINEYKNRGVVVTWDVLPKNTLPVFNNIELVGKLYPYVMIAGGKKAFLKLLLNKEYVKTLKSEIRSGNNLSVSGNYGINPIKNPDWDTWFFISRSKVPNIEGKSMREAALILNMDSVDALIYILSSDIATRCAFYYDEGTDAQDYFCRQEDACIGLDNAAFNYGYEMSIDDMPIKATQPAAYCGIIKYICSKLENRFEDTIKHLTGNAAKVLGLENRGMLLKGMAADIVVLDREKLSPNENFAEPSSHPKGIECVIINGKIAIEHDRFSHVRSGFIISKGEKYEI